MYLNFWHAAAPMQRKLVLAAVVALAAVAILGGCRRRQVSTPASGEADPPAAAPFRVEPRAPDGDAVEYTVRFPEPHTHYVEVEASVPTGGAESVEVFMPVWTPGSYLVREYARNVEGLEASAEEGARLEVTKTRKNRWRITTGGAERVGLRYRVYAREPSVRSAFVDGDLAVIVGAAVFVTVPDGLDRDHDVLFEPAEGWEESITALRPHADGRPHHYLAGDYDELVDSPVVLGSPALYDFSVEDTPHRLATFGEHGVWDGARAARDVQTVVEEQARFWQTVPYDRYVFLNVLGEDAGGLEHRESTLLMSSPWKTRTREGMLAWLGLASHEMFHTWNGKRLRPAEHGPFDYENEVYTRGLWIVEGITSYYDDLILRRAGLMTRAEYLERLSKNVSHVQTSPGRQVQSLVDASYDAWIKFYRADENFVNTAISYYRKGAVVAWLLDARIRRETRGEASLDDVMRLAFERFGGERGYGPDDFRAVASEVAGTSLDDFFAAYVDGTAELEYGPALDWFGLRFEPAGAGDEADEGEPQEEDPGYLGVDTSAGGGRIVVTEVLRGTPAHEAGINVDDELIAIGEHRLPADGLADRLAQYRPGEEVSVLVSRRGVLRRIGVTLGTKPEETWKLEIADLPTASQRRHLGDWLSADG